MQRILGLEALGTPLPRSVVTIGKFFAVHRGHQALLRATVEAARRQNALAAVLTFDRHPLEVLRPGFVPPLLADLNERLDLIEAEGVDVCVVARVDAEFLAREAEAFVRDLLVGRLSAIEVSASQGFRFGRGARGDLALLESLGAELGYQVLHVDPVLNSGAPISSSRIAAGLEAGRVAEAERLLGRPYSVPGLVVPGEQLGRELGFPTANVNTEPCRLLPADGIYVVELRQGQTQKRLPGVASLGVRPTLGGRPRLLEVHLLDWQGDLYGQAVQVEFRERLRGEERFPDLESLRSQIQKDAEAAAEYFRRSVPPGPSGMPFK